MLWPCMGLRTSRCCNGTGVRARNRKVAYLLLIASGICFTSFVSTMMQIQLKQEEFIKMQQRSLKSQDLQMNKDQREIPASTADQSTSPLNDKKDDPVSTTTLKIETVKKENKQNSMKERRSRLIIAQLPPIEPKKPICEFMPSNLKGPIKVNSSHQATLEEAIRAAGGSVVNGCYIPPDCEPRQKVAIVIPYKYRYQHLLTLMTNIHPIMQRQQIMYCVFVAEQYDDGTFNKASIMNAAFAEITKHVQDYSHPSERNKMKKPFDCFVFHDVDMLLEDDRNMYLCGSLPKHLSPAIDKFNYTTGYGTKYGGVTAIRTEHYKLVNGHSNRFWGWGGEDNDMEIRIALNGLSIWTTNKTYGRYKMIQHEHPWWFNPKSGTGSYFRKTLKQISGASYDKEVNLPGKYRDDTGVNNVLFSLDNVDRQKLWTKLTIDIRQHIFENIVGRIRTVDEAVVLQDQDGERRHSKIDMKPAKGKLKVDPKEVERTDPCEPVYQFFPDKTVNRTTASIYKQYSTVYASLEMAIKICNEMSVTCQSILQSDVNQYSLRATAYVQNNVLTYKHGLAEQHLVVETHKTIGVHVKMCQGDNRFIQFFKEPAIIVGDHLHGPPLNLDVDFTYHLLQFSKESRYTYRTRVISSHRAVEEEKYANWQIQSITWDSLSKIQFSNEKFINFTNEEDVRKHNIRTDVFGELIGSPVIRLKIPVKLNVRIPGCYIVSSQIIDDKFGSIVHEWKYWFELRGRTQDISQKIIQEHLVESEKMGENFKKVIKNKEKTFRDSLIKDMEKNKNVKKEAEPMQVVKAKQPPIIHKPQQQQPQAVKNRPMRRGIPVNNR